MPWLRVVYRSCLLQMKQSFSRTMFKFCILAYPLLYGWTLYLIFMGQSNAQMVGYVLLGTALSTMWGSISFSSAGDIDRERFMGALPVIFCAPAPFSTIMLGKVVGNTLLGLASMALSFAFILACFPVSLHVAHPGAFLLVLGLGLASFAGIAMVLSALLAMSRSTRVFMNCLDFPMLILCGVAFPIDLLPTWTRPLSFALSPTYVLKLARMAIAGITDPGAFWLLFAGLCALTALYCAAYQALYRILDVRARITASLEVF